METKPDSVKTKPDSVKPPPGLLVRVALFAPGQAPGSDAERVGFVDFTEHEGRRCIAEHATMAMQNGYTLVMRRATEEEARTYATDGPMRAGARAGRILGCRCVFNSDGSINSECKTHREASRESFPKLF